MFHFGIWADILAWARQSVGYLRVHVSVSSRVASAVSYVVWLGFEQFVGLLFMILGLIITLGWHILGLGLHIVYLGLLIILINFIKSIQPRYNFLFNYKCDRTVRHKDGKPLLECILTHSKSGRVLLPTKDYNEVINEQVSFKDALVKLYETLSERLQDLNKSCSSAVTDGNIQSIYKQLSWSSTRPEFESVYWFNHTLQSLWPASRTLINKLLKEATIKRLQKKRKKSRDKPKPDNNKTPTAKGSRPKYSLIKRSDIQTSKPKMSVYLSCRRQLELLHKNKERVMEKGDEYLGFKAAMMIMYLIKKFILCSKQYFTDQVCWLLLSLSSRESRTAIRSGDGSRQLIELDLNKFLDGQHFKLQLDQRKTKSACEPVEPSQGVKQQLRPVIRFRSAPDHGLACNSRRIISSNHLMSFDGIRKLRNKRQKLARSINEMVRESRAVYEKSHSVKRPITLEAFDFGTTAPRITAIKYLEKQDDLLAETLVGNSAMTPSDSNTMRLLVELSFKSGHDFNIHLSSVPVLDQAKLTKFNLRLRLLIAINHINFDDHKNLEIFKALDSDQLLPVFNQIQVTLVDMPQLDWHVRKANYSEVQMSPASQCRRRRIQRLKRKVTETTLTNLVRTPRNILKRNLQPIRLINNSYFKYLIHAAIYRLQRWFQPFDILIGEKFYLKTLW